MKYIKDVRSGTVLQVADEVAEMVLKDPDIVEVSRAEPPKAATDPNEVPSGSAAVVLGWVDGDKDRAARALEAERAKGDRARSTLVADLQQVVEK